jgi:ribonuclease-3
MENLSGGRLAPLEARIGLEFRDKALLEQALTHRSYRGADEAAPPASNERLEFLGDAVLSAVVSFRLHDAHPDWPRGALTKARAAVVSKARLAEIARGLGLGEFLLLGKGEERSGGRARPRILACALEALIGAGFVELAFPGRYRYAAQAGVRRIFGPLLDHVARLHPDVGRDATLWAIAGAVDKTTTQPEIAPSGESSDEAMLAPVEARIGFRFPDRSLLRQALVRDSYVRDRADRLRLGNGRLAFLGDALLHHALTMHIYAMCPTWTAKDMTELRNLAADDATLGAIGRDLGLGESMLMSPVEEARGGRTSPAALAGAVKALVAAAIQALEPEPERLALRAFVLKIMEPSLRAVTEEYTDHKSAFQEWALRVRRALPRYRVLSISGPDHNKTFVVEVRLGNQVMGSGAGSSKRQAQQEAARQALANAQAQASQPNIDPTAGP